MKINIIDPFLKFSGRPSKTIINITTYYLVKLLEIRGHIVTINDFKKSNDVIIIQNRQANFFGGIISNNFYEFCKTIFNHNGLLISFCSDTNITFKNFAEIAFNRTKDSFFLKGSEKFNNYDLIFAGTNADRYLIKEKNKPNSIDYIPFFEWMYTFELHEYNIKHRNLKYHICYHGKNRGSYRNSKIRNFCKGLNTLLIGMELDNFNSIKSVDFDKLEDSLSESISSITISDYEQENRMQTCRFYQNMMYGLINFIDIDYDPEKLLIKNDFLKNFLYVSNSDDIKNKINNNLDNINEILYLQNFEILRHKEMKHNFNFKYL